MCKECGCGQDTASCPQCGGSIILVDGEPVCATCGATLHTHDDASHTHSHGDHTHRHVQHTHDHADHTHTHHHVHHTHDRADHTHTHHHAGHTHDHSDHSHAQGTQISAEDVAKLHVLVPHWIEHNKDHATGFRDWATRARTAHLESVANKIEAAAVQMEACNQILSSALEEL